MALRKTCKMKRFVEFRSIFHVSFVRSKQKFYFTAYLVKFTGYLQCKLIVKVDGRYMRSLYVVVELLCARYCGLFTGGPSWRAGKALLTDRACMEKVRLLFAASKGWILAGA